MNISIKYKNYQYITQDTEFTLRVYLQKYLIRHFQDDVYYTAIKIQELPKLKLYINIIISFTKIKAGFGLTNIIYPIYM